jgi:iron-sulfur cluster repair protein YtfE (RIC family)
MQMRTGSLTAALEHVHREIDEGIAAFTAAPSDRQPLADAICALRRRIYLEEEILFPLLYLAEPGLAAPVFVMLREHAQIWALLDALECGLGGGAAGLAPIRQLKSHLLQHGLREERILGPYADEALSTAEADRLRAFLDTGELPDGWVCFRARSRWRVR